MVSSDHSCRGRARCEDPGPMRRGWLRRIGYIEPSAVEPISRLGRGGSVVSGPVLWPALSSTWRPVIYAHLCTATLPVVPACNYGRHGIHHCPAGSDRRPISKASSRWIGPSALQPFLLPAPMSAIIVSRTGNNILIPQLWRQPGPSPSPASLLCALPISPFRFRSADFLA